MYFMPILVGVAVVLAYPSLLLAGAAALATWLYLAFGGMKVTGVDVDAMRGQIAFRILSVKILSQNGAVDDNVEQIHALTTPDLVENANLRGDLRAAASVTDEQWEPSARTVYAVYRDEPEQLVKRMDGLIIQASSQSDGIRPATQTRLMEIARMWRIGPKVFRELLADNKVEPAPDVAAWR